MISTTAPDTLAAKSLPADDNAPDAFASARRAMIDSQLRPGGVNTPWVLAAMARVKREAFVPAAMRAAAYADRAVSLGEGRMLAAPLVHGRMLSEAAPEVSDTALVISDSAYLAALLGDAVASVTVVAPEAAQAGITGGPFSLILIDGAAEELPAHMAEALTPEGRLVTGLVARGVTRLAVGRKAADAIALLPIAEIGIPVLGAFAAPRRWSF